MSTSLSLDCWRTDEPAATDPLDQRTWASLRLVVDGRCASRFWNRRTNSEAEVIYVPTFPLAQWAVANWWQLFYEPCRSESPPQEKDHFRPEDKCWLHRHCLRSAESGLFLPYLQIYSDGRRVCVAWSSDDSEAYPGMPGYFLSPGFARLDACDAMTGMSEFIAKVLSWCEDLADERVPRLQDDWTAITNADPDESAFCRAAGRMGLDPYEVDDWKPELVDLLSNGLGARIDGDLAQDMLESVDGATAAELWQWIANTESAIGLTEAMNPVINAGTRFRYAKDQGYFVAQQLRSQADLAASAIVDDIASVAKSVGRTVFFEYRNHLPSRAVFAAVGSKNGADALIIGPMPKRPENQRFLLSRGLYQALAGCGCGPRLITRAHTWDQQASRAFAAELLAPRNALAVDARADMEPDERRDLELSLADHYQVSTEVVRLQLENEGVWRQPGDV